MLKVVRKFKVVASTITIAFVIGGMSIAFAQDGGDCISGDDMLLDYEPEILDCPTAGCGCWSG